MQRGSDENIDTLTRVVQTRGRTSERGGKPEAMATYDPDTRNIRVRVDDPMRPAFWLEIQVPYPDTLAHTIQESE